LAAGAPGAKALLSQFTGTAAKTTVASSGLLGAAAGSEVNVRKLAADLGIDTDVRTGTEGEWTLDFLGNSWFGMNRSWKATPGQSMYAQNLQSKRFAELRSTSVKELRDAFYNGSESQAIAVMGEIKKLYNYEYANVQDADREFIEWGERMIKSMGELPIYQGFSNERIDMMIKALQAANQIKYDLKAKELAELKALRSKRALERAGGLRVTGRSE
jgi:hypothetical protein